VWLVLGLALGSWLLWHAKGQEADAAVLGLRGEVKDKGWILFSAKSEGGDYDLFLCRPDGSGRRNLTRTPEWNEYGGRFSPDSRRMLYRRQAKAAANPDEPINHDTWGAVGVLMMGNADGTGAEPQGREGEFPWASWGVGGKQFACLHRREGRIRIFDTETRQAVRELPRQGIFQQLYWSGDGKRFCGTANLNGRDWNILSLDAETGGMTQVSRNLACTADWFQANPAQVVYSCRIPGLGSDYGITMLMHGGADGKSRGLIYGEAGRHVYYGCISPDDRYVVFSVSETDGGTDSGMRIMRLADGPVVVPADFEALRELYPGARSGPVLAVGHPGFEPHWTYRDVGGS